MDSKGEENIKNSDKGEKDEKEMEEEKEEEVKVEIDKFGQKKEGKKIAKRRFTDGEINNNYYYDDYIPYKKS